MKKSHKKYIAMYFIDKSVIFNQYRKTRIFV